jgi:hypothetical protein
MTHLSELRRFAALIGVVLIWVALLCPARSEVLAEMAVEQLDAIVHRTLESGVWGEEMGGWHSKTQLVFEASTRQLGRKLFTVWDPMPSRNLDFAWTPASAVGDDAVVSGEGRLVWRTRDRPTYDRRSIVIEYIGAMRGGRPDGRGHYRDESGVDYEGEWADGLMQGQGRLRLPNGDEYQGAFLEGRPHGRGRYIDAAGEIYSGAFVAGRRHGTGMTTLPDGTIYQSEWRDGMELASSRSVRLAQNRNAPTFGMPTAGDLQLNLLVAPVRPGIFKAETPSDAVDAAREALGYVGSNTERGLVIRPDKERLMGMWKGNAEIQLTEKEETQHNVAVNNVLETSYGVFSLGKTLQPPLDIIVEVANRATAPVQIKGITLEVSRSVTDLQPAIQVSLLARQCSSDPDGCTPYVPRLGFENFGWGPARNTRLRFSFVVPTSKSVPDHFDFTKPLSDLNRRLTVDFEPELKAAGADTGFLAKEAKTQGFKCDVERIVNCITKIGGSKVFGSLADKVSLVPPGFPGNDDAPRLVTMAAGVLEYQWTDASGQTHSRVSPFRDILWLGRIYTEAEKGEGSATERPIRETIQLQVDRSDYLITRPFQREVPAGRVAAYSLPMEAPRASEHDFTLVLQLADGREIRSRPIHLLYFLPSWQPKYGS